MIYTDFRSAAKAKKPKLLRNYSLAKQDMMAGATPAAEDQVCLGFEVLPKAEQEEARSKVLVLSLFV